MRVAESHVCARVPADIRPLVLGLALILAFGRAGTGALALGLPPAGGPTPERISAPVAVFGKDDRTALPKRYEGLRRSIGILLNPRTNSMCTAFCVGDDLVATAAHCMFRTAGEPLPRAGDVVFMRDREDPRGQSRIAGHQHGAAAQHVVSGSMRLNIKPPIEASRDWAVLRLAAPVCRGASLPVRALEPERLEQAAGAGRVFQVAYHRDFESWRPAYSQPCSVKREFDAATWRTIARDFVDAQHLILHSCDTGGASSGSPILLDGPDGPEVIGINVGTYVQSKVMMQNGEVLHRSKADAIANTAVGASAFHLQLEAFRSVVILVSGARIKELQSRLKHAGHYAGQIDGGYGPALKLAIEAYERAQGLPVTGLATDALLRRLNDGRYDGRPPRDPETGTRTTPRRMVEKPIEPRRPGGKG